MKVRKGDKVIVIAGNDKGRTGEVRRVLTKESQVVVDGVNLRWITKKPSQQSPKGQRFQEERPIHSSNVMLLDADTGKGTRKHKADKKEAKATKAAKPAKAPKATKAKKAKKDL
jgi:large subunit ribosomal protein L24